MGESTPGNCPRKFSLFLMIVSLYPFLFLQEYTSNQLRALINSVAYSNNKTKQKLNQMVTEISEKIARKTQLQ